MPICRLTGKRAKKTYILEVMGDYRQGLIDDMQRIVGFLVILLKKYILRVMWVPGKY